MAGLGFMPRPKAGDTRADSITGLFALAAAIAMALPRLAVIAVEMWITFFFLASGRRGQTRDPNIPV